jgi:ATP-binding protein involved in chromosome partitioning
MAERYGVELLGALPLDIRIREAADGGRPTVLSDPDGTAAQMYKSIARKAAARLALRAKDYSGRFPTITVVNS